MQQALFISILWGNADSAYPGHGFDPQNYGWKDTNVYYTPDWFLRHALPDYFFMNGNEKSIVYRITRVTNQMLLLFLKMMMIQIPKMLGVMTRRVKLISNRFKNDEDFM